MSNIYAGFGKIIRVVQKTAEELGTDGNLLELSVSVFTGERKKDEDEYPPQIIFKLALWGKYGDVLADKLEVGSRIAFSGELGTPEVFENKNGETVVNFKLQPIGTKIKIIDRIDDGESKPAYTANKTNNKNGSKPPAKTSAASKSTAKPKGKPAVTFADDDLDDSTDFFDS